jgi:preprotein translocase subunit YajC
MLAAGAETNRKDAPVMGIHHVEAAAAATGKTTGGGDSFLIILVVFAVLMIFMFRSQRRRQRNAQNTQSQVMNGSRVRTTFGVFGTVVDGDDRNVIVEIAPGTQIKMLRQAIAAVVPDDEPDGVLHTEPNADDTSGFYQPDQEQNQNGDGTAAKPDDRSDLTI